MSKNKKYGTYLMLKFNASVLVRNYWIWDCSEFGVPTEFQDEFATMLCWHSLGNRSRDYRSDPQIS